MLRWQLVMFQDSLLLLGQAVYSMTLEGGRSRLPQNVAK
jgi:hypothetical protein